MRGSPVSIDRSGPAVLAYVTLHAINLRHYLSAIQPGESVLVVSHGGIAESGIIGLLAGADASGFGPALDYCEGVRLELDGDTLQSVRLLRFEGDLEVEVDPGIE